MNLKPVWSSLIAVAFVMLCAGSAAADDMDFSDDGGDMDFSDDGGDASGDDGGDLDFTDGGGEPEAAPQYTADPNSPTYATLSQAKELSAAGKHYQASLMFHDVMTKGGQFDDATGAPTDETAAALRDEAAYELGRTLYLMGFYQSALSQFETILNIGPGSPFFEPTLQWLVLIARRLPGHPELAKKIAANYEAGFEVVSEKLRAEVGFLIGQAKYEYADQALTGDSEGAGPLDDVIFYMGNVGGDSELYGKARYYEAVTYVRKFKTMPEKRARSEEGRTQLENARETFKLVVEWVREQPETTREDERVYEMAVSGLARVNYQLGHHIWKDGNAEDAIKTWNQSINTYAAFSQGSRYWLDSLFEAGWAYYMLGYDGRALGLLHTLNSPFFNDEYYPEAMLLQAQVYFTNCHYDRVMYILNELNETYVPLRDRLESQLAGLLEPQDYYGFLREVVDGEQEFDPTTQQVLRAALKDRKLNRTLNYISALEAEMTSLSDAKSGGWSSSPLANQLKGDVDIARRFAEQSAGENAQARLQGVFEELKEVIKQARFIEIETNEALGAKAELQGLDASALAEIERELDRRRSADDEHIFWTFDGEYWKDELGYYWYFITDRCTR